MVALLLWALFDAKFDSLTQNLRNYIYSLTTIKQDSHQAELWIQLPAFE